MMIDPNDSQAKSINLLVVIMNKTKALWVFKSKNTADIDDKD